MIGINLFVDTNILVYLLNGNKYIADILDHNQIHISFITELELLSKQDLSPVEIKHVQGLINQCIVIDINDAIKKQAITLRKQYRFKIPDALVAASAMYYELPLLTSDKQFSKIQETDILILDI